MRLLSVTIEHFRSYPSLHLSLAGQELLHLFLGPNGSGKTNLLEAVSVLSSLSSFLRAEPEHLTTRGQSSYRICAIACRDDGDELALEVITALEPRRQRAVFLNGVRIPTARYIGLLPTVTFAPEHLDLFTASPDRRRHALDVFLIQIRPEYHRVVVEYHRVLRQRNALLKRIAAGGAREGELEAWDAQLAEHGAQIQVHRLGILQRIGCLLPAELQRLGERWATVDLSYMRRTAGSDLPTIQSELAELLVRYRERDLLVKASTVGPHRDDWRLVVDGQDIAFFASRGQQRVGLLAFLFTELLVIQSERGEWPVVLLDDVFSELDDDHQLALLAALRACQALVTATHEPALVGGAVAVWQVGGGTALRAAVGAASVRERGEGKGVALVR